MSDYDLHLLRRAEAHMGDDKETPFDRAHTSATLLAETIKKALGNMRDEISDFRKNHGEHVNNDLLDHLADLLIEAEESLPDAVSDIESHLSSKIDDYNPEEEAAAEAADRKIDEMKERDL